MTKYIIFDNKLRAEYLAYHFCSKASKAVRYKWRYQRNLAGTKSCLKLDYKPDQHDLATHEPVKSKCAYNTFKELYKALDYEEVIELDTSWKTESSI